MVARKCRGQGRRGGGEGGSSAGLDVHQPPASRLNAHPAMSAPRAHSLLFTYLDDGGHGAKGGGKEAEVKRGDDQEDDACDPTKRKALHFSNCASDWGSRHNLRRELASPYASVVVVLFFFRR